MIPVASFNDIGAPTVCKSYTDSLNYQPNDLLLDYR